MAYRNSPYLRNIRKMIGAEVVGILLLAAMVSRQAQTLLAGGPAKQLSERQAIVVETAADSQGQEKKYIKWVDFTVSYEALCKAYDWDVDTHGSERELDWIELLAYAAARTGGSFGKEALTRIDSAAKEITGGGATMEELTADLQYYPYYKEAYTAALGGLVGEYREECVDSSGQTVYEEHYGLKGYFPLARGFDYTHYDDFGAGRSYGYQRRHLGHDMMGLVGTPIMAIESGVVEALGWNQYGGWRIGIRSFDGHRYYYYAHLRQNYPYAEGLEEGSVVTAGDVIGYG